MFRVTQPYLENVSKPIVLEGFKIVFSYFRPISLEEKKLTPYLPIFLVTRKTLVFCQALLKFKSSSCFSISLTVLVHNKLLIIYLYNERIVFFLFLILLVAEFRVAIWGGERGRPFGELLVSVTLRSVEIEDTNGF